MKINYRKILTHIVCWIAVISLHYHFIPRPELRMEDLPPPHSGHALPFTGPPIEHFDPHIVSQPPPIHWELVFFYSLLISFYYFNSLVLIPNLLAKQKRKEYMIIVVFLFLVILCSLGLMGFYIDHQRPQHPGIFIASSLLFCITFIVSSSENIVNRWYKSEQREKEIEYEKTLAELSFLKAQINPHFLFNTLNNIYSLAIKNSEQTPDAIIKLADMMRYVLNEAKHEKVLIEQEIEYINKFIALQKMRFTAMVTVEFNLVGEYQHLEIAPLLLIPFIENAFKYGASTHEESTISININIDNHTLLLNTKNRIFDYSNMIHESHGIGVVNAARRLELLYPQKHTLLVEEGREFYTVQLRIEL